MIALAEAPVLHTRRSSLIAASLGLVIVAVPPPLSAAPRVVLVAAPDVDSSITPAVAASISRAVDDALRKVDARRPTDEETRRAMRDAGVSSLETRADSTRVAQKLGAHALLRYQATLDGYNVRLRAGLFTIAGKMSVLERAAPLTTLGPTVEKMIVELIGAPPAAASPPSTAPPASRPAASQPAPPAAVAASKPPVPKGPNPHAASGFVFRAQFGLSQTMDHAYSYGAKVIDYSVGFSAGAQLGWAVRLGRWHALVPEIAASFHSASVGVSDEVDIDPDTLQDTTVRLLVAGVGLRWDICVGPVVIWPALHLGYGLVMVNGTTNGYPNLSGEYLYGEASGSGHGFAIDGGFGVQYMFTRGFGLGLFFNFAKAIVGDVEAEAENGMVAEPLDSGTSAFSFGLLIATKIPSAE